MTPDESSALKNKHLIDELRRIFPEYGIEPAAQWDRCSSLGAGTAPFLLISPPDAAGLKKLLEFLKKDSAEYRVLGAGTNFAGADAETDTVFITLASPGFQKTSVTEDGCFESGAGLPLSALIDRAADAGLGGMSGLSGIPGTVGGAVMMNAGANGVDTGMFVKTISAIDADGREQILALPSGAWGYRRSPVPEGYIVTKAVFRLRKAEPDTERKLIASERLRRSRVTPKGRSAGSVFRNPAGVAAGRLLEDARCKGLVSGAFAVSSAHANWIVRRGGEGDNSLAAFLKLIETMRERVRKHSGITLDTEIRFADPGTDARFKRDNNKMLNILLLKGGVSSEREVSLISGKAVADALRSAGHNVTEFDITKLEITDAMRNADVVYPVLHGGFGEDGRLQKMLEDAGIKFVGCSSQACIDIMDKAASKKIMKDAGIRTPEYAIVTDPDAPLIEGFGFPVIVKPPCEGSTFGLTLVESPEQWKAALELAFKHDKCALVERYVKGVESTAGILDGKALPLVEIRYPGKIYDYDAKYTHAHGETKYICPPSGISEKAQKDAQKQALAFYNASGARDMLRVDVIIDADDNAWVLEGNTLPGCTPSSLLPKAAGAAGIPFAKMCSHLAGTAAKRN